MLLQIKVLSDLLKLSSIESKITLQYNMEQLKQ